MEDPVIGRVLGNYQIISLLGQGGMARVYSGYDPKLDRYAAVKVTELDLVQDDLREEYETRFLREARAIAHLNHPNIVGVYQFDQLEDVTFMAMHFIEGQDLRYILRDYHEKGILMPRETVLRIITDIAAALDHAHAHGVIHRDIKPSNIMVTPDGTAILTDFGLALNMPEGTFGTTFGSAHYIAPEQAISSAQAVPQSDFYSLGIVLYEMVTGQVPFDDPSTMSVALKHLNEPPPLPSSINPEVSPEVEDVIMHMLRKNPLDRYENGAAMVAALEAAFALVDDEDDTVELPTDSAPQKTIPVPPASPRLVPAAQAPPIPVIESETEDTVVVSPRKGRAAIPAQKVADASPKKRRWSRLFLLGVVVAIMAAGGYVAVQFRPSTSPVETNPATQLLAAATARATGQPEGANPTTPTATSTPLPTATFTPAALPPTATQSNVLVIPDGDLLLLYDADSVLLVNQSDAYINIEPLEFRRRDPEGEPIVFFRAEDLNGGLEPPDALPPGNCFHLWRMDLGVNPQNMAFDTNVCTIRVGWRSVSDARWFWIDEFGRQSFEVRGFGRILTDCEIAAGRCVVPLP